jgi:hypothetical protein
MRRITGGGLAAALLLAAAPALAQGFESGLIVDLHVNAERENVSMRGSVQEGGKFRLARQGGPVYAISPRLADASRRQFLVTVFRGRGNDPATAEFEPIETVRATLGVPVAVRSIPMVSIVIDGTRRPGVSAQPVRFDFAAYAARMARSRMDPDVCCVSCNGWVACGCGVRMDCGMCCVGTCCDKMDASAPFLRGRDSFAALNGRRTCRQVPEAERLFTPRQGAPSS